MVKLILMETLTVHVTVFISGSIVTTFLVY